MAPSLKHAWRRRYRTSSSFQMALLFSALLGAAALILCYIIDQQNNTRFVRELGTAIDTEAAFFSYLYEHEGEHAAVATAERGGYLYRLDTKENTRISGNITAWPAEQEENITDSGLLRITSPSGDNILAKRITLPGGETLTIARDISELSRCYTHIQLLGYIAFGLMLCVVIISYGISRFVVNKINRIAGIARDIMATGDLSRRIADDSRWDDLGELSYILDQMFSQLEILVNAVRDVSDNIAHDLRTPLTRLKYMAEELRDSPAGNHTARAEEVIAEADRLLNVFNAVMRISRIEKSGVLVAKKTVALADLIADVRDMYLPYAEEKQIELSAEECHVSVCGDNDLLFQALVNMVDNAIKFTPSRGHVTLSCNNDGAGYAVLAVQDNGTGLPEEDLNKVAVRFYRSEKSRQQPGNGLGLAMVKAVAESHGGYIAIKNTSPGLCVALYLPLTQGNE